MRWLLGLLAVGALICLWPAEVEARTYKVVRFLASEKQIYLSFTYRKFFTKRIKQELASGFDKVIQLEALVYRVGSRKRVARISRRYLVRHELWEGTYRVLISDSTRRQTRQYRVNKLTAALRRIGQLQRPLWLSLGALGTFPRGARFYVDVVIRFAPLPPGFLRKVREWLKHPVGPSPGLSRGGSPLGQRFSIIVNSRISRALKTMRFRTQQFWVP